MKKIPCALCSEYKNYEVLYKKNFDFDAIDEKTFSARRIPDGCHYRIVRCKKCGLVFSSPILEPNKITALYKRSNFTYEKQIPYLKKTYIKYFQKFCTSVSKDMKILDIGCGNGFFLETLHKLGFLNVFGIEPSKRAVLQTPVYLREKIKVDILRNGIFPASFFDVATCFHTLDHIVDSNEFLAIVFRLLKKNGSVFFIVHDVNGLSARFFGEKSPIFDIEHIYLFNKKTLRQIFKQNGFKIIGVFDVKNTYPLSYWFKLIPVPKSWRDLSCRLLEKTMLWDFPISIGAGNIGIVASK